MAKLEKITNSYIKGLDLNERRVNDSEISGFHLRISPKGKITYYLFYRISGKQVNFKLGNYPDLTPTQARDLAKAKLGEVANGVDVQGVKKKLNAKLKKINIRSLKRFWIINIYLGLKLETLKQLSASSKLLNVDFLFCLKNNREIFMRGILKSGVMKRKNKSKALQQSTAILINLRSG